MKKSARFFIFLAAFLAALAVCILSAKKINADIFSLVNYENSSEQAALKAMLDSASSEFLLVSNSPEFLEKSEILAEQRKFNILSNSAKRPKNRAFKRANL